MRSRIDRAIEIFPLIKGLKEIFKDEKEYNQAYKDGFNAAYMMVDQLLMEEKTKMVKSNHDTYNQGRVFVLEDLIQKMWKITIGLTRKPNV